MSKIKVDTIQSTQHATSTIGLTSTGATINGDCSATTFTGSGANLTNLPVDLTQLDAANLTSGTIPNDRFPTTLPAASGANLTSLPAANLTGALPAIDGSALTGVGGGGALEFVSRTYVSSASNQINLTGFDYERVYKLIIKRAQWGGSAYQNLYVRFFINGNSSPQTAGVYNYIIQHAGGHYTQNNDDKLNFYQYGGENQYVTATFEIYTGYYGYLRGAMHHVGTTNGIRYADIRATLNPTVMSAQRISGVRLYTSNYENWQVGTEILLFRYKES